MAKRITRLKMSSVNVSVTLRRKMKSPSTPGAIVEAWGGNSGRSESMSSLRGGQTGGGGQLRAAMAAREREDPQRDEERGRDARDSQDSQDGHAVASGRRIILVAEQQQRIDERARLPFRRFGERQPQVPRRVLDAEEVARDAAVGREDDDRAGVRELPAARVGREAVADRAAEGLDRARIARQEPPALR